MIFIFFSVYTSIADIEKITFLLFFSTISFTLTMKYRPFTLPKLNAMERQSNMAALITIFSGALYLLGINDTTKALSFFIILLVNMRFFWLWIFTVFHIYMNTYERKIFKCCPGFLNLYAVWQKTSLNTDFNYNFFKYAWNFMSKFKKYQKSYTLKSI